MLFLSPCFHSILLLVVLNKMLVPGRAGVQTQWSGSRLWGDKTVFSEHMLCGAVWRGRTRAPLVLCLGSPLFPFLPVRTHFEILIYSCPCSVLKLG